MDSEDPDQMCFLRLIRPSLSTFARKTLFHVVQLIYFLDVIVFHVCFFSYFNMFILWAFLLFRVYF